MEPVSFSTGFILIIAAGLVGGLLSHFLKQPIILGYIVAGIIVGPYTHLLPSINPSDIQTLADIGVALLLFSIGLEFSKKEVKPIAGIALFGTILQVGLTLGCGYLIAHYIEGWSQRASLCFGLCIVSSSTAVIMKSLVSRGNMSTLSGKLMMGMSIVQDLTVIPLMLLIIPSGNNNVFQTILYVALFIAAMHFFGSWIVPKILQFVIRSNSKELFSLAVIGIALGVGFLADRVIDSFAFGAFIAGMVLSESDYGHRALSELIPIRDIFGLLFFVSIGTMLNISTLQLHWQAILFLFLAGTFLRGIILSSIGWSFGYRRVIPIAMLLGMLPISEISFIVIQKAKEAEVFSGEQGDIILCAVVISMIFAPMISGLTTPIYNFMRHHSGKEMKVKNLSIQNTALANHIVVTGDEGVPYEIGLVLKKLSLPYVIIESGHNEYKRMKKLHLNVIYGDPFSDNILECAGVSLCRVFLVMMVDTDQRNSLIYKIKTQYPNARIIAQAETLEDMQNIKKKTGADVIHPDFEAAFEVARQVLLLLNIPPLDIQNFLTETRQEFYRDQVEKPSSQRELIKHLDEASNLLTSFWVMLPKKSKYSGKSLKESGIRSQFDVTVTGIMRNSTFVRNPAAHFVLESNDFLSIIGERENCKRFAEYVQKESNKEKTEPFVNQSVLK